MELEAALAGLRAVVTRGWHLVNEVELISDSSIALDIAGGRFMPRKHVELATSLRETAREARATTRWVRAHSGHRWNEVVDVLAHEAKRRLGSSPHPDPLPHGERESR
jgi:ribonuclease HI